MFMQACARAPWTPLVARVMLALVFVVAGFNKLQGFDGTVGYIGTLTNESVAPFLTVLAIVFELGGGLMLLFNWKVDQAITMLIVFTIVATILGHSTFTGDPQADSMQVIAILKNVAIIGGLLLMGKLACCGNEGKCCRD
jgi:putative oxidoreductase